MDSSEGYYVEVSSQARKGGRKTVDNIPLPPTQPSTQVYQKKSSFVSDAYYDDVILMQMKTIMDQASSIAPAQITESRISNNDTFEPNRLPVQVLRRVN
jgi:hypothetical protein